MDPLRSRLAYARGSLGERRRMRSLEAAGSRHPGAASPTRPVFVIGCPRSGTSVLFALLRRHPELRGLEHEGHVLWNRHQHPRRRGWSSDRCTADDVRPGEAAYLYGAIAEISGGERFIDKTPKNVLRLPYLARLFPGASFVFVARSGRSTVSSLIEGWTRRAGVSYRLPQRLRLRDYQGRLWNYILTPGWRELDGTTIADVAAHQYVQSNEIALEDAPSLPAGAFIEVRYEDLVAAPSEVARSLLSRLELEPHRDVLDMAENLGEHQIGSISPPDPRKWERRADALSRVGSVLAPTMARLGYTEER